MLIEPTLFIVSNCIVQYSRRIFVSHCTLHEPQTLLSLVAKLKRTIPILLQVIRYPHQLSKIISLGYTPTSPTEGNYRGIYRVMRSKGNNKQRKLILSLCQDNTALSETEPVKSWLENQVLFLSPLSLFNLRFLLTLICLFIKPVSFFSFSYYPFCLLLPFL